MSACHIQENECKSVRTRIWLMGELWELSEALSSSPLDVSRICMQPPWQPTARLAWPCTKAQALNRAASASLRERICLQKGVMCWCVKTGGDAGTSMRHDSISGPWPDGQSCYAKFYSLLLHMYLMLLRPVTLRRNEPIKRWRFPMIPIISHQ